MASCLSTLWTCITTLCKMLYQLKIASPYEYSSNYNEPLPITPTAADGDKPDLVVPESHQLV